MMRCSSLFLSVALILSLQFASVLSKDQELVGVWQNPSSLATIDNFDCCIPDSITIEKSDSGWIAEYNYKKGTPTCGTLFVFVDKKIIVVQTSENNIYEATMMRKSYNPIDSSRTPAVVSTYQVKGSKLIVKDIRSEYSSATCHFSMTNSQNTGFSLSFDGPIISMRVIVWIIVLSMIAYVVFKKPRKQVVFPAQQNTSNVPRYAPIEQKI